MSCLPPSHYVFRTHCRSPAVSPCLRARVDVYECRGKRSVISPRGALNLPAARFLQTKRFDPLPFPPRGGHGQIRVHDTLLYITHVESVSGDPSVTSLHQQLTRRLDILVGGQLQRGMTQKKNTRSKAENIFTPMVLGIHSSRLTRPDKNAVRVYLSAFIGILWTSAEVRKTI